MAFSLPFIIFLIIGNYNITTLTYGQNAFALFINLFCSMTGNDSYSQFVYFFGKFYLIIFSIVYFIILDNFLIAMFVNTYKKEY